MPQAPSYRRRIQILVEVNTDPVPGWGNDPEDYVKHIQRQLDQTIPHYKPEAYLIPENLKIDIPKGTMEFTQT